MSGGPAGSASLRAARVLALAPLGLGIGVFLLWRALAWDFLMVVGGVVVWLGVAATLLGAFLLVRGWHQALRGGVPPRPVHRRAVVTALLLAVNYPAAAVLFDVAWRDRTAYVVLLRNESAASWSGLGLAGGGVRRELGVLAAGDSVQVRLWFVADGSLELRGTAAAGPATTVVEGYVTRNFGGTATVVLAADGRVHVTSAWR